MENVLEKEKKEFLSAQDITLIALFAALITICSFITIPVGPVPFTLQTFGVFATAGILGTKRGVFSVVIYVLLGVIGIPVFGGSGGVGVIAGVTGGYITGFIFSALIIGMVMSAFQQKPQMRIPMTVIGMVLGDTVCFIIGTIQFMAVTGTNLSYALATCVIPFIIPDLVKIVVATVLTDGVKKYVRFLD